MDGKAETNSVGLKIDGQPCLPDAGDWGNFHTPKTDTEDELPISRHNSMDDTILRDRLDTTDTYWSADYKDDAQVNRLDSVDSHQLDNEDRLSVDLRLEQSLGHPQVTDEIREDYGYMSAPEAYVRLIPSVPKRRSRARGRSRSRNRDLMYYNTRSRSVSRTRTFYKGVRRHKSLENLSYRRRAEKRIEEALVESDESEEEEEEEEEEKKKGLKNSTFRQKVVLACLAFADFNSFMCLALMAPFFPQEAEERHVTTAQTGWIFGVFALVQCLTSPFFGKLLPHFGARFTFLAGNFFAGGCTILFGMVEYFPDNTNLYLVFTFLIRIFLAVGCTAVSCSIFALATSTFPDNPSFVLGLLESAIGVGLTAGPALGGVLYDVLGFKGPFFVVGGIILLTTPLFAVTLDVPPTGSDDESTAEEEDGRGLFCRLLCIPTVILTLFSTFISSVAWIIFDPILEPHLRPFNLSSSALGGVFLLMSGTYAILAPFVGKLADHMENSTPLMIAGHLVGCGSMLVIGPSPLIGLGGVNELWINLVALFFMGVSVSLSVVPTFDKLLDSADRWSIKESFQLHGVIGGLWTSIYAFGEFVGPTMAGWAMSYTSFDWFLTYCAAGCLGTAVLLVFLWIYEFFLWNSVANKKDSPKPAISQEPDERTPLIPH